MAKLTIHELQSLALLPLLRLNASTAINVTPAYILSVFTPKKKGFRRGQRP